MSIVSPDCVRGKKVSDLILCSLFVCGNGEEKGGKPGTRTKGRRSENRSQRRYRALSTRVANAVAVVLL